MNIESEATRAVVIEMMIQRTVDAILTSPNPLEMEVLQVLCNISLVYPKLSGEALMTACITGNAMSVVEATVAAARNSLHDVAAH